MQIKDIVNRDIVNLTNCEQEPIHIPGSIQPHGFLLALAPGALTIEFCSENVAAFLSISHTALLGKSIYTICENGSSKLFEDPPSDPVNCIMRLDQKEFECSIHSNGTYIVVEAEPVFTPQELTDVYEQTKLFLKYMEDSKSLMELCQLVA